mmetsp:Transcript_44184/g.127618  ORF Transcript_44184/g.127618 Transcript_44184/m.127618 type:complete len:211 (-) Transcript_44184:412-1044(-)
MRTKQIRCVLVVLRNALHEGPTVHIDHVRAVRGPKEVEAAHPLAKCQAYPPRHLFLLRCEDHRIAHLLAVLVAIDNPVDHRALPGLRVRVLSAHCVDLYVGTLRLHEGLVEVAPIGPDGPNIRIKARGPVLNLPEEPLHAAPGARGVVDADVVVLSIEGLLDEGLRDALVADQKKVVALLEGIVVQHGLRLGVALHEDGVRMRNAVLFQQ